ncbi:hypothetical protein B0H14DRAFT_2589225 [Mycena olivaceomarginata]|nr:hypothetical protein B0H14DRAFT_2589225 [Mycena olivaceomarginata]
MLQGFSHFVWAAYESKSDIAAAVPPPPVPTPNGDIISPDASVAQTSGGAAPTTSTASTAADPHPANDNMDNNDMDINSPEHDPLEGLVVNLVLRCKMIAESQTLADLEYTIGQFSHLSECKLVCANNITHNKETLANLGLNKTFEEAMGLPAKKARGRKLGQKLGGKGGGGGKAKNVRGEGERTLSDEDEEEEEEKEEEEPCPAQEKHIKPTPKAAAPKEWVKKARVLLEEGDFGLLWSKLMEQWWLQGKGFVSPMKGLPAKLRLAQATWWQEINPAWRKVSLPMSRLGAWICQAPTGFSTSSSA